MKIAVISDLHIGDGARSIDLIPKSLIKANHSENNFIKRFSEFVKKESITADYLLLPGDITNSGTETEVLHSEKVLQELQSSLGGENVKIIYIPGNHDIDRSLTKCDDTPSFETIKNNTFFSSLNNGLSNKVYQEPYFYIWEYDDIHVLGLNTSWNISNNDRPKHGYFCHEFSFDLENQLHMLSKSSLPKVCVFHHHPILYENAWPGSDFSTLQNADALMNILRKNKFDLIIHGHRHASHFQIDFTDLIHPIVIVGAGSFSKTLDMHSAEHSGNQFHLIEIGERNDEGHLQGILKSWKYSYTWGWQKNNHEKKVNHEMKFGSCLRKAEIIEKIESYIENIPIKENIISWNEICNAEPSLKNINNSVLNESLTSIKDKTGFEEMTATNKELYLIKKRL